jgi:hypothetical protein
MNLTSAKLTAFLIHLTAGFVVLATVYFLIRLNWYPGALFKLEDVWAGLKILLVVDLVLGPILTFVVYNPNKKSLKYDLAAIILIQTLALAYGAFIISKQRPAIITFVGDRFEVITISDKLNNQLPETTIKGQSNSSLPYITFALPAQSAEEKSNFILQDFQYKYDASRHKLISQHSEALLKHKLNVSNFQFTSSDKENLLQSFIQRNQDRNFALFALEGTRGLAVVIAIDLDKQEILEYLDIDPWVEYVAPR